MLIGTEHRHIVLVTAEGYHLTSTTTNPSFVQGRFGFSPERQEEAPMRTKASRPQATSIALASLFAMAVIGGSSPASAGCPGVVSSYQHTGVNGAVASATGVHTGPTAASGSMGAPSISSCLSTANTAITAHGAVGAAGIHMPSPISVHHNSVANNQHTNALQAHNSSLGMSKSAKRVKP
jgi:hypothetical protein